MGFKDQAAPGAPRLSRALGGLTALAAALALSPPGEAAASTSCSATALRVGKLSTARANAAGKPCRTAESGARKNLDATDSLRVLGADTTANGPSGAASADVIRVADAGTSGPTAVRLLGSDAYVSCRDGKPVIVGGSSPARLDTTAQTGSVSAPGAPVTVPGLVYVNETRRGANSTTYRALRVGPENGGIVAGESTAGYTRNPC